MGVETSKVFRLHKEGSLKKSWENIDQAYDSDQIEGINSPDGNVTKKPPTSIPSPFARIDLVRTAFDQVNKSSNLTGNTVYHKLVSDTLDVAELFFNSNKFGDQIKFSAWDRDRDLPQLLKSNDPKHRLYGETLELFLEQDAASNNFNELKRFYFLSYNHKIVGGTSPVTLFYPSANDLSFAQIKMGSRIFFTGEPCPLYKRDDVDFIEYIYLLMAANPYQLNGKMKDLRDYLDKNLEQLEHTNPTLFNDIKSFTNNSEQADDRLNKKYESLDFENAGNSIEVLGCILKRKSSVSQREKISNESQFLIDSQKFDEINTENTSPLRKPLVLQNRFTQELVYTAEGVNWNRNWTVPYVDEKPIQLRTLPEQMDQYPYLTVSDFLQPYLVRVPYPLNSSAYFDGNLTIDQSGDDNYHFLLPLTSMFFEYFDTEDLTKPLVDGSKRIEMRAYKGSVEVKLRIPIKGNSNTKHITFERTYEFSGINSKHQPDLTLNQGVIIDKKISLLIAPFAKISNDKEEAFYRVMTLDTGDEQEQSGMAFYSNNTTSQEAIDPLKTTRTLKIDEFIQTDFYILNKNFDFLELSIGNCQAIIIPKWPTKKGASAFTFSVDFGTTNTHIEYSIDGKIPSPFEITNEDLQYETLHSNAEYILKDAGTFGDVQTMNSHIRHEFLPALIQSNTQFNFPIRTAVGYKKDLLFSGAVHALADLNIPFDYEHFAANRGTKISTNLKWSNFQLDNNQAKLEVEKYLEELILLIRAKVILNNGALDKTKIVWFYPSSMGHNRISALEKTWNQLSINYFKNAKPPEKMSESLAPFYFYENKLGISSAHRPVVSLDIGGGTSDFVVFHQGKPIVLSSMRYAANSVFGDGYGGNPQINGFILKYGEILNKLLVDNRFLGLSKVEEQIRKEDKSEDLIAFYFSLEKNKTIRDNHIPISISDHLSNDSELKIVFILFYSSIIYHIAQLMKKKNLEIPENILLTGTGSKVIPLISGDSNFTKLEKLTQLIFEHVYQEKIGFTIELNQEKSPKEITAKGGLYKGKDEMELADIMTVLLGDTENTFVSGKKITYDKFEQEIGYDSIEKEVNHFIEMIFSLHDELNFNTSFGVDPRLLKPSKDLLQAGIMKHLKTGLERKKKELGDHATEIEESLFFYPLIGGLNELAYKLVTKISKE